MKLTAQDLQIGDCFYRPDCVDKVVEIRKNGVIGLDLLRGLIPFSEIKGISITPEILEKNAFEKALDEDGTKCYRYCNSTADGYIKITLYDGLDGDWGIDVEKAATWIANRYQANGSYLNAGDMEDFEKYMKGE